MLKMTLGNKFDSALKAVKIVLGQVVHRVFLSKFTWTGKSKPGSPRKMPFQIYEQTINLIFDVVSKIHTNYNRNAYEQDLINKVLKGAYE